jgi:hypothetical protein
MLHAVADERIAFDFGSEVRNSNRSEHAVEDLENCESDAEEEYFS